MTISYRLTIEAQRSLIVIETYSLETFGKRQTARYMRELAGRMEWLAHNQNLGRQRPDLFESWLCYSYPQGSHIIFYEIISPSLINIIDVLHKSMEPELHLDQDTDRGWQFS